MLLIYNVCDGLDLILVGDLKSSIGILTIISSLTKSITERRLQGKHRFSQNYVIYDLYISVYDTIAIRLRRWYFQIRQKQYFRCERDGLVTDLIPYFYMKNHSTGTINSFIDNTVEYIGLEYSYRRSQLDCFQFNNNSVVLEM